jgi:protein-tyrosine phosphatase
MRSPFAGAYLRLRAAGDRSVSVQSAGMYERSGRAADPRMLSASRQWGVDLTSHRSQTVTRDLVSRADLVLVMDRANLNDMRRLYPEAAAKTYLLGSLDAEGTTNVEIPDPYDDGFEATERVCRRIAAAVDRLVVDARVTAGAAEPGRTRRSS